MDKIAAGQQALIERGQIKEAIDFVRSDLLDRIAKTLPEEHEKREDYYFEYRALDRVLIRLQYVIDGAKMRSGSSNRQE